MVIPDGVLCPDGYIHKLSCRANFGVAGNEI